MGSVDRSTVPPACGRRRRALDFLLALAPPRRMRVGYAALTLLAPALRLTGPSTGLRDHGPGPRSVIGAPALGAHRAGSSGRSRERRAPDAPQRRGHAARDAWTIAPALGRWSSWCPPSRPSSAPRPPASPHALHRRIGKQWWWEYRYPSSGGHRQRAARAVGRPAAHARRPTSSTASGCPRSRQARRGPGPPEHESPSPRTRPAIYWGQCAEICGTAHANMPLRVMVDRPAAFERWARPARRRPSRPVRRPRTARRSRGQRLRRLPHHPGRPTGAIGPDLTHFGGRRCWPPDAPRTRPRTLAAGSGTSRPQARRHDARTSASRRGGPGPGRLPPQPK